MRVLVVEDEVRLAEMVRRGLVAVGDEVAIGDAVMTVEMEKAVIEIESPHAGTVKHIIVAPGDIVVIGQLLMDLE